MPLLRHFRRRAPVRGLHRPAPPLHRRDPRMAPKLQTSPVVTLVLHVSREEDRAAVLEALRTGVYEVADRAPPPAAGPNGRALTLHVIATSARVEDGAPKASLRRVAARRSSSPAW